MENNASTKQNPSTYDLLDRITDELSDASSDLTTIDGLADIATETFNDALESTTTDGQELLSRDNVHGIRNNARNALKALRELTDTIDDLKAKLKDILGLAQERLDA